ncbi:hypothetical protein UCRPC4_g02878 [Phaeomoniella chlamydospora]|uniref:SANT domain-containing protein n=1 Tax=Phaeomoniella chlamydospora TaxID=158046 RepID=A0A0G2H3U4_PHACM|nr:hypothetical protein UCRPC4_g02878 [Phaeomoniella chlamydospora]
MSESIGSAAEVEDDELQSNSWASDSEISEGQSSKRNYSQSGFSDIDSGRVKLPRYTRHKPPSRKARSEKLRPFYSDKYVELLNETYADDGRQINQGTLEVYDPGQHGIIRWTSEEKELFFQALSRKGRHDVKAISDSIGSKTVIEVIAYLKLLQDRSAHRHLYLEHPRVPALSDVSAAIQIGPKTEEMLEYHAAALRMYQENVDNLMGLEKHERYWIIDTHKAKELDEQLEMSTQSDKIKLSVPQAELFRLSTWIQLSTNIFMNPALSRLDENWRNLAFDDESPSITLDAVAELHEIVISLTRRLVQTALVVAQGRLRSRSLNPRKRNKPFVTQIDVSTALEMLNMPQNTWKYWSGAPRRCQLQVYFGRTIKEWTTDYDQIEQSLQSWTFGWPHQGSSENLDSQLPDDESIFADASRDVYSASSSTFDVDEWNEDDNDVYDNDLSGGANDTNVSESDAEEEAMQEVDLLSTDSCESSSEEEPPFNWSGRRVRHLEKQHHMYAERQDIAQGYTEENRLWKILGKRRYWDLPPVEPPVEPRPYMIRKSENELTDWMPGVLGKSSWEEHGSGDDL